MKKLTHTIITITSLMLGSGLAWAYPFGPPNGVTSAPGDRPGVACSGCHRGTLVNGGGGNVKVAFPSGLTYTPGQTQNLMISIVDGVAATYGFEMTARLESAPSTAQAGSFTAGTGQRIICSTGSRNLQPDAVEMVFSGSNIRSLLSATRSRCSGLRRLRAPAMCTFTWPLTPPTATTHCLTTTSIRRTTS